nr:GNAT family N-acetyltransferase [uncultured Celeribacter sp.]
MTPKDLAALHAVCFETPRPWSETEFAGLLSMPGVFLVTGPGPGFAMGRRVMDETELLTIAVHPDARGRGHGRALLSSYETAAYAAGGLTSFLEVAAGNTAAISLYLAEGYTESGRRRAYYTAPDSTKIDALVFTKLLIQSEPNNSLTSGE